MGRDRFVEAIGLCPELLKVQPGHFYSMFPDIPMVESRSARIFGEPKQGILGVTDRMEEQLSLAAELEPLIVDFPYYPAQDSDEVSGNFRGRPLRYRCDSSNKTFHLDAIILQAMLRYYQPKHIVEIGSGYSSAIMLDVREQQGWSEQSITFIEPYSQAYFYPLLKPEDRSSVKLVEQPVWDVDRSVFESLGEGDLLFIDSSHVAKIGSDVYDYLFNIFPLLKPGVLIHVHDITAFFEVSPHWFKRGLYWNEGAFLRAFLMYNSAFEVIFHSSLLRRKYPEAPGIRALLEHREKTFLRKEWHWANSFYLRRV